MVKPKRPKEPKPCGLCMLAKTSARLDQAHDAMVEMLSSGRVQATAATESSINLEQARFWIGHVEELARRTGATHRKSCPGYRPSHSSHP